MMLNNDPRTILSEVRKPFCLALLGPTCSGKTSVALELAERMQAEIISCDSMQIYRGMDIGTAKPSSIDRAHIPHHLIDVLPISERYTADRFVHAARRVLQTVHEKGSVALLVGGTGMYAKALIYDYDFQPSDPAVYRKIEEEYSSRGGPRRLVAELHRASPTIDGDVLENPRRLLRAVEVLRLTGHPPSPRRKVRCEALPAFRQYILLPSMRRMRACIEKRTVHMLSDGWIEETEDLLACGFDNAPTARHALGYSHIADYLRGVIETQDELRRKIVGATVKYCRRQRTWFRRQHPGAAFLTIRDDCEVGDIAAGLAASFSRAKNSTSY
ncbi:MAG: tRNA (adenosine(37)-N6)-dimethylallyltransferase MiaA [Candidatus Pacebacteria bacterium]|nr:tRNA (adenosine(37)-N6)-dimethylallyltransferase MiaA [Candidatus Paceibacterota bacterium]